MLKTPKYWGARTMARLLQRATTHREQRQPEKEATYAAKLQGHSHLSLWQQTWSSVEDLEFSPLGFNRALVQYFLTMPQFLSFEKVIHIQCIHTQQLKKKKAMNLKGVDGWVQREERERGNYLITVSKNILKYPFSHNRFSLTKFYITYSAVKSEIQFPILK